MNTELSANDIRILELLQENANLTTQEIAEHINMSQSPCWRRINRLQEAGYIKRNAAILDREKLGMEVVAFVTISLSAQSNADLLRFEEEVQKFPEVIECYTMAGIWDYMLKIVTKDIRHYEMFIRGKLTTLERLREVHSHMAVTEIKNTTALPLISQL